MSMEFIHLPSNLVAASQQLIGVPDNAPEVKSDSLETASDFQNIFRDAIHLFREVYKIRDKLGLKHKQHMSTGVLDGYKLFRDDYVKLKKFLRVLGTRLDSGVAITDKDTETVKGLYEKLATFHNRVIEHASDQNVTLTDDERLTRSPRAEEKNLGIHESTSEEPNEKSEVDGVLSQITDVLDTVTKAVSVTPATDVTREILSKLIEKKSHLINLNSVLQSRMHEPDNQTKKNNLERTIKFIGEDIKAAQTLMIELASVVGATAVEIPPIKVPQVAGEGASGLSRVATAEFVAPSIRAEFSVPGQAFNLARANGTTETEMFPPVVLEEPNRSTERQRSGLYSLAASALRSALSAPLIPEGEKAAAEKLFAEIAEAIEGLDPLQELQPKVQELITLGERYSPPPAIMELLQESEVLKARAEKLNFSSDSMATICSLAEMPRRILIDANSTYTGTLSLEARIKQAVDTLAVHIAEEEKQLVVTSGDAVQVVVAQAEVRQDGSGQLTGETVARMAEQLKQAKVAYRTALTDSVKIEAATRSMGVEATWGEFPKIRAAVRERLDDAEIKYHTALKQSLNTASTPANATIVQLEKRLNTGEKSSFFEKIQKASKAVAAAFYLATAEQGIASRPHVLNTMPSVSTSQPRTPRGQEVAPGVIFPTTTPLETTTQPYSTLAEPPSDPGVTFNPAVNLEAFENPWEKTVAALKVPYETAPAISTGETGPSTAMDIGEVRQAAEETGVGFAKKLNESSEIKFTENDLSPTLAANEILGTREFPDGERLWESIRALPALVQVPKDKADIVIAIFRDWLRQSPERLSEYGVGKDGNPTGPIPLDKINDELRAIAERNDFYPIIDSGQTPSVRESVPKATLPHIDFELPPHTVADAKTFIAEYAGGALAFADDHEQWVHALEGIHAVKPGGRLLNSHATPHKDPYEVLKNKSLNEISSLRRASASDLESLGITPAGLAVWLAALNTWLKLGNELNATSRTETLKAVSELAFAFEKIRGK